MTSITFEGCLISHRKGWKRGYFIRRMLEKIVVFIHGNSYIRNSLLYIYLRAFSRYIAKRSFMRRVILTATVALIVTQIAPMVFKNDIPQEANFDSIARWIVDGALPNAAVAQVPGPGPGPGPEERVDFVGDIQPIINANCAVAGCHVPDGIGPMSLVADVAFEELLNPGIPFQPRVIPGNPENSIIVERLEGRLQPQMPLDQDPLPQEEIALIRRWIAEGANRTAEPPGPGPGEPFGLVSVTLDGVPLTEDAKSDPVDPGEHTLNIIFDASVFHLDPEAGDVASEVADFSIFPAESFLFADVEIIEDGMGISVTEEFPEDGAFQIQAIANFDTPDEAESHFYFGTKELSDAKVSGFMLTPEEADVVEVTSDVTAVLLSESPEAIFGVDEAVKAAAKGVAAKLGKIKAGQVDGENGSGDGSNEEQRLIEAVVRVSSIATDDLSFEFLFVEDGTYHILVVGQVVADGSIQEIFGIYDIEGDGESDEVVVSGGRGVDFLEVQTFLTGEGGEPPPPPVRGIVARVELERQQFAIGRNFVVDPDQVLVIGGRGDILPGGIRDLQRNFPVVVFFEPGPTPKAFEIHILRPGQREDPHEGKAVGTVDRVDEAGIFLVEQFFQFNPETEFLDEDEGLIGPEGVFPGDFVEAQPVPHDPPPPLAVRVSVLPAGFAPGQDPDRFERVVFITPAGAVPANGATLLATNPRLQVSFNGPVDQDYVERVVGLRIIPHQEWDRLGFEARNGNLLIDLGLEEETSYTMYIFLVGRPGSFIAHFSTGDTIPGGGVTGQILPPPAEEIPGLPAGAVLRIEPTGFRIVRLMRDLPAGGFASAEEFLSAVAGMGIIHADGSYTVRGVLPGDYYPNATTPVIALGGPEGPQIPNTRRRLGGRYDLPPGDGQADQVSVGDTILDGIDIHLNPPAALMVDAVFPADNSVDVQTQTTIMVGFTDVIAVNEEGFPEVEIQLFPEAASGPIQVEDRFFRDDGKRDVSINVELEGNTTYQIYVFYAESSNEELSPVNSLDPFSGFSTGPNLGTASLSGMVEGIPDGGITRDAGHGTCQQF